MNADAETYERAINALSRQNDQLHRQVRTLKAELARLQQAQIAELLGRGRLKEPVHDVCPN